MQAASAALQNAANPDEAGLPSAEELQSSLDHVQRVHALKEEGNAAMKTKQYKSAVDKYSAAIAETCSAAFAALLYSNRAAAYHAQSMYTEAIGDCGRARALYPDYTKAHSRLATLMLEVRDLLHTVLQQQATRLHFGLWSSSCILPFTALTACIGPSCFKPGTTVGPSPIIPDDPVILPGSSC